MSSKKIAIVGAGAVGLYLAWKLSALGHRVSVFEKNAQVGRKPCSGLISERIKGFIPWRESLAENRIGSCLMRFPGKTVNLKLRPVHFAVCRQGLDQYLAQLAQKSGAELTMNYPVREIPGGFDVVVGCDGALSVVRKKLGLPNPGFRLGVQGYAAEENGSSRVEVWPEKTGFFWKIPRSQKTEYGLIGEPRTALRKFREKWGHKALEDVGAAMVPQSLVVPKTKNVTLCGDAMGLCKPWSGGGVIWGLTAANILLKHFPDLEAYHREVEKFFRFRIFRGRALNKLVLFLGSAFPWILPGTISRDNDFPAF